MWWVCMYGKQMGWVVWWLLITSLYFKKNWKMIILCIHKMNREWGGKANTSVWAVLKCWPGSHPGSHNEDPLTLLNVRTRLKTDLRFSHDRKPVMRSSSNVCIYMDNRTYSLIELRSGSQSSLYHLLVGSSCSSSHLGLLLLWYIYIYIYIYMENQSGSH
jgi:hypothetical protein